MLHRAVILLAVLATIVLLTPPSGRAGTSVDLEKAARIKAAYLYHLARLVVWPQGAFVAEDDSLRVCIVGEDPYGLPGLFRDSGRDLKAGRHPLSIETLDPDDTVDLTAHLRRYHLVFFTENARNEAWGVLRQGPPPGVLVTAEIDGFCENGGMVGFEIGEQRVRIEVNQAALRHSALRIGAEFLQHATLVAAVPDERD